MTTPVRPQLTPTTVPPARPDPARLAAQRAFFAAALGQASPAAPAATTAPLPPTAGSGGAAPTAQPDSPQKILRPGSLLDIRV